MKSRVFDRADLDEILDVSLLAWEPVFRSFEAVLGREIYLRIYPDWTKQQAEAVTAYITNPAYETWVAEVDGQVAGFVCWEANQETQTGEVHMLAVHPDHQRQGIGTALNELALARLKDAGMTLAVVGTGGDPGHAPARAAYEKAGYRPLPIVRYYKAL